MIFRFIRSITWIDRSLGLSLPEDSSGSEFEMGLELGGSQFRPQPWANKQSPMQMHRDLRKQAVAEDIETWKHRNGAKPVPSGLRTIGCNDRPNPGGHQSFLDVVGLLTHRLLFRS